MNPSELSDATKSKLIAKAMSRPDYKTRLCQSYSQSQTCEYNDLCHFAHGEHELRKVDPDKANPFFKTVMCKKGDACENGDSCVSLCAPQSTLPSALTIFLLVDFCALRGRTEAFSQKRGNTLGSELQNGHVQIFL